MQSSGTENLFSFILYVDNILLASSDVSLLLETKMFLSSNFDMKDLGEASFVLEIKIHRDRRNGDIRIVTEDILRKGSKEI
jgi:hypothetical protein